MGMAASQARYLSLTARKSNVEYQGQQINQQRTSLANESANLYEQLTNLEVPTPPSTNDYYEDVYTFTSASLSGDSNSTKTTYTLEELTDTYENGLIATLSYSEDDYVMKKYDSRAYSIPSDTSEFDTKTITDTTQIAELAAQGIYPIGYSYVDSLTNKAYTCSSAVSASDIDFKNAETSLVEITDDYAALSSMGISISTVNSSTSSDDEDAIYTEITEDEYNMLQKLGVNVSTTTEGTLSEANADEAELALSQNQCYTTPCEEVEEGSALYQALLDAGIELSGGSVLTKNSSDEDGNYILTNVNVYDVSAVVDYDGNVLYYTSKDEGGNTVYYTYSETTSYYAQTTTADSDDYVSSSAEEDKTSYYATVVTDTDGNTYYLGEDGNYYAIEEKSTESGSYSYYALAKSSPAIYCNPDTGAIAGYVSQSVTKTQDYTCTVETNDVGRMTSITVVTGYDENDEPITETFELTCTSVCDEEAYDQAMLDYEYYQSLYNKEYESINAETEAIQQKDKKLELKLTKLDTEQNAISTEMDAVSSVIEKNVESSFKTFG